MYLYIYIHVYMYIYFFIHTVYTCRESYRMSTLSVCCFLVLDPCLSNDQSIDLGFPLRKQLATRDVDECNECDTDEELDSPEAEAVLPAVATATAESPGSPGSPGLPGSQGRQGRQGRQGTGGPVSWRKPRKPLCGQGWWHWKHRVTMSCWASLPGLNQLVAKTKHGNLRRPGRELWFWLCHDLASEEASGAADTIAKPSLLGFEFWLVSQLKLN